MLIRCKSTPTSPSHAFMTGTLAQGHPEPWLQQHAPLRHTRAAELQNCLPTALRGSLWTGSAHASVALPSRLLPVPRDSLPVVRPPLRSSLPVVRPPLRSSLPVVTSVPTSRPPPVPCASVRAVTLTRAPRTPRRTPSERRPSLSGGTAPPALLCCARGSRRSSWWPPGCLTSTVHRPLTGR
jgi:hypothetical protein